MPMFSLFLLACTQQEAPDPKLLMQQNCGKGNPQACFKLGTNALNAATPQYGRARSRFSTGCSVHHAPSCNALGLLVRDARGGPKDMVRAATLFETACEKGSSQGCVNYAELLRAGEGVDTNPEKAAELYRAACEAEVSSAKACAVLAEMVRAGEGVEKDKDQADALLIRACDDKHAPACVMLGNELVSQRGKDNIAMAVEMYDKACGIDAHYGCYELAKLHHDDKAPNASFAQAGEYYSMVCRADTSRGCYELAELMSEGKVESREGEKEALYKLSCESGFSEACAKR